MLGAKKAEETIAVLRSRLSSSSSCFFSLMTLARSSDSVSMRSETCCNGLEQDATDWSQVGSKGLEGRGWDPVEMGRKQLGPVGMG